MVLRSWMGISNILLSNMKKRITFSLRKNQTAKQSGRSAPAHAEMLLGFEERRRACPRPAEPPREGRQGRAVGEAEVLPVSK